MFHTKFNSCFRRLVLLEMTLCLRIYLKQSCTQYFHNSLSFLNCNIMSLQANFDNLVNMLSELYFPISVLGVTDTKLKNDEDALVNINLTGYNFLSQPSGTNAGVVGFYVKDNLVYTNRSDLSAQKQNDHESLWIEIQNNAGRYYHLWYFLKTPSWQCGCFSKSYQYDSRQNTSCKQILCFAG